jgi:hypothetical protein
MHYQSLGEIPNLCNSLNNIEPNPPAYCLSYSLNNMKPGEVVIGVSPMRGSLKDGYG